MTESGERRIIDILRCSKKRPMISSNADGELELLERLLSSHNSGHTKKQLNQRFHAIEPPPNHGV